MAPITKIVVHHNLAVEARPNDGADPTAVTRNTHVHLLPRRVQLDVGVLETTCMDAHLAVSLDTMIASSV